MIQDDGPEISPNVVFLFDLLDWVRKGDVRVPGFQRDYVWTNTNMRELFDSVRYRYPIGTLLFWRTRLKQGQARRRLGPFELPEANSESLMLILDGQQRLTTLAGVLLQGGALPMAETQTDDRWRIYFDAAEGKEGEFTHLAANVQPKPWQVPLHNLTTVNALFEAIDELRQAKNIPPGVTAQQATARLQEVSRARQSYKIPIVEFKTENLTLAVESFTRLNKRGTPIGADEMFSALTFEVGQEHGGFHIARAIDDALGQVKSTGFGDVERMVVLRAFLVVADLDPYRTDWARLGQETRDEVVDKLPAAMQRATDGLLRAITLLRAEGIHNERMLPYGLQLLGLAVWLAEDPTPRPETILLLRRWLWLTGFSAWFGQGNPSRYARLFVEMVREARKTAAGAPPPGELQNLPWSTSPLPMPTRFDMRSARVRTLLSILARPGCRQPDGVLLSAEELAVRLLQRGPDATRRIAARSAGYASSPANRMFDVFDGAREQARTLLRRNDVNQEFCESHLLPWPLRDALSSPEGVEELLAERQRRISIRELDLLRELKLELYTEGATGPSPIDREDEAPVEPPN